MATITSPASTTSSVTPTGVTSWWLKDPATPSRNRAIAATAWNPSQIRPVARFDPVGRTRSVVLRGPILGDQGTLGVRTLSEAAYDDVAALLNGASTLLLQDVLGHQWYVEVVGDIARTQIKAAPDTGETTPVRNAYEWSIPLLEVDSP